MTRRATTMPRTAMVLSAGLGLRLRPLTIERPKPLVEVAGRTLIDRVLDRLAASGIERVVVNLHHLGDMIRRHLADRDRPEIAFSDETDELLETGGGVARALDRLGDGPFFVVNSDTLWFDCGSDSLARLAERWDPEKMDALLLLQPTVDAFGYRGVGDFVMDPAGALMRRPECEVAPFLFTGVQLLGRRLFAGCPDGPFSLNLLYDKAAGSGRLFGLRHEGEWLHVGSPEGLAEAEKYLRDG